MFIVDKMSTMLVRDSSDLDDSTENDMELEQENVPDVQSHSEKIFTSSNGVDKRLVKLYRTKRWHEDRKKRERVLQ